MKQKLFKAFALLLTLITVMSLVACGGGSDAAKDTDLTGTTWALSGGSQGDTTVDKATLETLFGGEMTYTFNEDGRMTAAAAAAGVEVEGTWTQDGTTVTIDMDGQSSTMTIDGDKLLLEQGDITVEFTKK